MMLLECKHCLKRQQISKEYNRIMVYENSLLNCLVHYCDECQQMSIYFEAFSNFYLNQIQNYCSTNICDTVDPVIQKEFDDKLETWLTNTEKRLIVMFRAYLIQINDLVGTIAKAKTDPDLKGR